MTDVALEENDRDPRRPKRDPLAGMRRREEQADEADLTPEQVIARQAETIVSLRAALDRLLDVQRPTVERGPSAGRRFKYRGRLYNVNADEVQDVHAELVVVGTSYEVEDESGVRYVLDRGDLDAAARRAEFEL